MNLAETHDLLTFIAAYDNRRFDDATVLAWQPIFATLPFADCRTAVTRHFAESTEYLMPAHVRLGALELDRDRRRLEREARERAEIEAAVAAQRDRSAETYALIAEVRSRLPDTNADVLRRPEWVEHDKARARAERAEPNPHYTGPPPPDGHPTPAAA